MQQMDSADFAEQIAYDRILETPDVQPLTERQVKSQMALRTSRKKRIGLNR